LPDVVSRYSFASVVTILVAAVTNGIKIILSSTFVESPYPIIIIIIIIIINSVVFSKISMSTAYICNQIVTSTYPSEAITYICRTGSMEDLQVCVETAAGGGFAKCSR
jgi:hypothetical protein